MSGNCCLYDILNKGFLLTLVGNLLSFASAEDASSPLSIVPCAARPQKEISLSAHDFLTSASMRWAVRPLPPGGKMQSSLPPALTSYFFVKTKFSSIFTLTSLRWVQYWLKPPL